MNLGRFQLVLPLTIATTVLSVAVVRLAQEQREGYRDTPILPGQKWHVHDPDRPYPHEVIPGDKLGEAPSDAVVLFDGKDLNHWEQEGRDADKGKMVAPKWKLVGDGSMQVAGGTGDLISKDKFGDCQLHIEWSEEANITGTGQSRGNSGVYLMSHYEVQVLDSYKAHTYADGQAGAIYGQWPPLVNPIRPPGQWQSYDIVFTAPKWKNGKVVEPAYETVFFNGVLVHNHQKLNGSTGHRDVFPYERHADEEPLLLQDHGTHTPVRYRNIWVRRLKGYDQPE